MQKAHTTATPRTRQRRRTRAMMRTGGERASEEGAEPEPASSGDHAQSGACK